jgi:hypothetical protein
MLKVEISQVSISQATAETKVKLAEDVMRLLQVREKNQEMSKDWLIFISTSNYKLTAGEIYLAHKMAMTRELLQENGKEFDLIPELSINTTAKIISAYQKLKIESQTYQSAKQKIKSLKTPKIEISESEKKKIRLEFLKIVFDEIQETGFSDTAWCLYNDCEADIEKEHSDFFSYKKILYNQELEKHKNQILAENNLKNAKRKLQELSNSNGYVINHCKSILASKHLKNITDFEQFKNKFL